jgi:hypothetical protein
MIGSIKEFASMIASGKDPGEVAERTGGYERVIRAAIDERLAELATDAEDRRREPLRRIISPHAPAHVVGQRGPATWEELAQVAYEADDYGDKWSDTSEPVRARWVAKVKAHVLSGIGFFGIDGAERRGAAVDAIVKAHGKPVDAEIAACATPPSVASSPWASVRDIVRARRPALASVLDHATLLRFSCEEVAIAYQRGSFLVGQVMDPSAMNVLYDALREHFGQDVRVTVRTLPDDASSGMASPAVSPPSWEELAAAAYNAYGEEDYQFEWAPASAKRSWVEDVKNYVRTGRWRSDAKGEDTHRRAADAFIAKRGKPNDVDCTSTICDPGRHAFEVSALREQIDVLRASVAELTSRLEAAESKVKSGADALDRCHAAMRDAARAWDVRSAIGVAVDKMRKLLPKSSEPVAYIYGGGDPQ